jgi:hypothetical protein
VASFPSLATPLYPETSSSARTAALVARCKALLGIFGTSFGGVGLRTLLAFCPRSYLGEEIFRITLPCHSELPCCGLLAHRLWLELQLRFWAYFAIAARRSLKRFCARALRASTLLTVPFILPPRILLASLLDGISHSWYYYWLWLRFSCGRVCALCAWPFVRAPSVGCWFADACPSWNVVLALYYFQVNGPSTSFHRSLPLQKKNKCRV